LCAGIRSIGEMAVSLAGVDSSDFILSEVDLVNDFLSHIASDSKEHQVSAPKNFTLSKDYYTPSL
jgi:hypothetical protein